MKLKTKTYRCWWPSFGFLLLPLLSSSLSNQHPVQTQAQSNFLLECRFSTSVSPKYEGDDGAREVVETVFPCSGAEFGLPYGYDVLNRWTALSVYPKDGCTISNDGEYSPPPSLSDDDFLDSHSVRGKVAFVRRGGCSFAEKVLSLQRLGATAVVIGDYPGNDAAETSVMGSDEKISPLVTILSAFAPGRATRFVLAQNEAPHGGTSELFVYISDGTCTQESNDKVSGRSALFYALSSLAIGTVAVCFPRLAMLIGMIYFFGFKLRWGPCHRPGASRVDRSDSSLALIFDDYGHIESDERVFKFLAEGFKRSFRDYCHDRTTSPTASFFTLLKNYHLQVHEDVNPAISVYALLGLAKENYDAVLFHHPPLFSMLTAFWEAYFGLSYPSLPVLLSLLPPTTTALLGILWDRRDMPSVEISVLSLLLMPSAAFCSQKLWSDNLLAASVWLSTSFAVLGVTGPRFTALKFLASGLFLGLGMLVKVTALGALPGLFLSLFIVASKRGLGQALRCAALAVALPMAVYGGWVCVYAHKTGSNALSAMWPSSEMVSTSEFMKATSLREWHFYLTSLVRLWPVVLVAPISLLDIDWTSTPSFAPVIIWIALAFSYIIPFTLIGINGGLYQSRHILPCVPALACLVGRGACRLSGRLSVAFYGLLVIGAVNAIYGVVHASPLNGDLEVSIWDVAANLPSAPAMPNPSSEDEA
eukprot:CAMPEP_0197573448 /NCGR_PEP_ID=MMETSP1320-20131121/42970_1 /TAXON_ID=91990 /ORGANISM="Bolidomonas sp., Strain RCC2347" /LENGTH=702 /DNA_ID=CAMNT_0043135963 /DNA_START=451 /DNA_END=2555 /DNA_ORIENTATION=+